MMGLKNSCYWRESTIKTLFKNGKVYDGTGAEPFVGDVLIEDDRVVSVGKDLDADALKTTGRAVRC